MSDFGQKILFLLKNKKLHIMKLMALYVLFLTVFVVLLFPFSYLSNYLTTAVAKATRNQVFIKSEDINLSLFPSLGVELKNVELETLQVPKLQAQRLIISPGFFSLIKSIPKFSKLKPGEATPIPNINVRLYDFLGSNTTAQLINKDDKKQIFLKTQKLNLKKLKSLNLLPIQILGELNLNLESLIDLSFKDQPEGDISINITQLTIPKTNIPVPSLGSIPTPKLVLNDVNIKGRISGGRLIIEQAQMGKSTDALNLKLKGQFDLSILPTPRGPQVQWGAYTVQTIINIRPQLANELFLTTLLNKFKVRESQQSITYGARVAGRNFYAPPTTSDKIESLPRN